MNIYEIADLAGVSISTVSRVLNNQPNVRPETRDKVQKVLDEKQYHKYVSMLELTAKNHAARIMDRQTASK